MTEGRCPEGADPLLAAIRALGDGPEPPPTDRLAAFLAELHARRTGFEAVTLPETGRD